MKRSSEHRAVAVDAVCVLGGFLAGIAAISLLSDSFDPAAAGHSFVAGLHVRGDAPHVNRGPKADRVDIAGFSERFAFTPSNGAASTTALPHSDASGRVLFWIDAENKTTIVPKNLGAPNSTAEHAAKPISGANGPPASAKTLGCEPLASSLTDPLLARFARRCMAQLPSPIFE
jgi:hypothetical protein